jgi:hypothetical protein
MITTRWGAVKIAEKYPLNLNQVVLAEGVSHG